MNTLETLFSTGVRVSELVILRLEDVDFEKGLVRVFGKGARERVVPLSERAMATLKGYLAVRAERFPAACDTLFLNFRGQPLGRCGFWWALKKTAKAAGITGRVFPHRIRHTAATLMLEGGADIREIQTYLGQSDIHTTEIYTHVSVEHLKKVCAKTHPGFSKESAKNEH